MKSIYLDSTLLIIFIFSQCDNPDPESEFETSLIPGTYDGFIYYQGFDRIYGDTIPGGINEDISCISGCELTISEIGELKYSLSVDNSFLNPLPNIEFSIRKISFNWAVGIKYLGNNLNYIEYIGHGAGTNSYTSYPPRNHFRVYEFQNIDFYFTIKSSNPDSVYYLTFGGIRSF